MKFIMLVEYGRCSEPKLLSRHQLAKSPKWLAFHHELHKAGALLGSGALHEASEAKTVRKTTKGSVVITDGTTTKDDSVTGGYVLIKVKDEEEAIAWAMKMPLDPGGSVEIRQVVSLPLGLS